MRRTPRYIPDSCRYYGEGRLIRYDNGRLYFFCMDGTIARADSDFLVRLLTTFQDHDSFSGTVGRWDIETDNMFKIYAETLAYINDRRLIIVDGSAFSSILKEAITTIHITTAEYAALYDKSPSRVKQLCAEGKIAGAVKKGNKWFIPKTAEYPFDNRSHRRSKEEINLTIEDCETYEDYEKLAKQELPDMEFEEGFPFELKLQGLIEYERELASNPELRKELGMDS